MHHDIVIIGAGPVGATLALALRDADLDMVALDARDAGETQRTDRALALSHGARLIYERLGVWSPLAAVPGAVTPIVAVDVSQARGFGHTRLLAEEHGIPALGYVVSYRALQAALDDALARNGIDVRYGVDVASVASTSSYAAVSIAHDEVVLTTRLAAVADGAGTAVDGIERLRTDYGQVALVAKVWTRTPHEGVAYERFTPDGPIALLPEDDHYGLIWTVSTERAADLTRLPDEAFVAAVAEHARLRAVSFLRVAARRQFPLVLEVARPTIIQRAVVIGNAAQALHPVAGQGFNLGLRDVWELSRAIIATPRERLGDADMLRRYARGRALDRRAGIAFTHGLVRMFGDDRAWLRWSRGGALALLDSLPPVKRRFTRAMLFGFR